MLPFDLMAQCAPLISPVTMAAIIKHESGGNPLALNDNSGPKLITPKSKEEAIAVANKLINAGHSVDMGLAQINSKNLKKLGLSVEQVFEPCYNLGASQTILLEAWRSSRGDLVGTLSAYNTGQVNSAKGLEYAKTVFGKAGVSFASGIAPGRAYLPQSPMTSSLTPKNFKLTTASNNE